MPIVIDYTGDLGAIGNALAQGEAIRQTRQNQNTAFDQSQTAQRTNIAQQVANRGDQMAQWEQQNAIAQRDHAENIVRLQNQLWMQRDQSHLDQLPKELALQNQAKLDYRAAEYTQEQQRALSAIDKSEMLLHQDDTFTQDQREAAKEQIHQKRLAIMSAGAISALQPSASDVAKKRMFKAENGLLYSIDHNGDLREHPGPKDTGHLTDADFMKAYTETEKMLATQDPMTGAIVPADPKKVEAAVQNRMMALQRFRLAQQVQLASAGSPPPGMSGPPRPDQQMQPPPDPPQVTQQPSIQHPDQQQIAAAQAQQRARIDYLFPPDHPFNDPKYASAVFKSKVPGRNTFTGKDLAQIAERTNTPIDQVIAMLVDGAPTTDKKKPSMAARETKSSGWNPPGLVTGSSE